MAGSREILESLLTQHVQEKSFFKQEQKRPAGNKLLKKASHKARSCICTVPIFTVRTSLLGLITLVLS